jgi:hypothetical protein
MPKKLSSITTLLLIDLPQQLHMAWAAGHPHNTWLVDSSSTPHSGQTGAETTFLLKSFLLVGRISLQARQRKRVTDLGTLIFQRCCQ